MKKMILLIFVSLSCFAGEPKFHFGDKVTIVRGFYKGCEGVVEELNDPKYDKAYQVEYGVDINNCRGSNTYYGYFKTGDLRANDVKAL
jgi:hypothetical protein